MIQTGPEDVPRYLRIFGSPPDDPNCLCLKALAQDHHGGFEEAHQTWQQVEQSIAANPEHWPGEQGTLARALIWKHMGDNAATIPSKEVQKQMPRFLREATGLPDPLKPTTEQCYEKALALAPKLLEAHEGLFHALRKAGKPDKAIKAANRLLELFPDHVKTLEEVAGLYRQQSQYPLALEALEKAYRHNPLNRHLRYEVADAHMRVARLLTQVFQFDEARTHYQTAMSLSESGEHGHIFVRWAACEIKANNQAKADELLAEARAKSPGELIITYSMLVETSRLQLGNKLKTSLTREFNKAIAETPTAELAVALLVYATSLVMYEVNYHGQQTHTKKIIAYAGRVRPKGFNEAQLVAVVREFNHLDAGARVMRQFLDYGQRTYHMNPHFYYLDAVYQMGDNPEECGPAWRLGQLLQTAEELARKRPADEPGIMEMLNDIKHRRQLVQLANPFMSSFLGHNPFQALFEQMGGFFDEDEDFWDEDDDDY
jgi:tetratricopeptide (TPR) repeat protein